MFVTLVIMVTVAQFRGPGVSIDYYPQTQVIQIGQTIYAKEHCEKLAETIRAMDTMKKLVASCVVTKN